MVERWLRFQHLKHHSLIGRVILFEIGYYSIWNDEGEEVAKTNIDRRREFYSFMDRYVSRHPREAYVNYKEVNIGKNVPSNQKSYANDLVYGSKYFKKNFKRLVKAKNKIDPLNFFRHEQRIPTHHAHY
ncbi:berberine bridge enzyme-like 14 [Rutidosis leptorrhynchoides]|uniref:berberine bridge enzyme-like 14 n=1 Tax=Rutidosis leptorrhynchoides TaxID=125765 RepID=UPI003A9A15A4